jgi:hypothetical protein
VRKAAHATRQYEQRMAAMVRSELGEEAGVCSPPPTSVPEDPLAHLLTKALESLRQLYTYLVQPSSGGRPVAPEQVEALAQQTAVCRQLGESWRLVESALTASEAFRAARPDPPPAARPPPPGLHPGPRSPNRRRSTWGWRRGLTRCACGSSSLPVLGSCSRPASPTSRSGKCWIAECSSIVSAKRG